MRSQTGEEQQFLTAHEHVDRIDLDDAHSVHDPAQVAPIDPPRRSGVVETLRAERDPTSHAQRYVPHTASVTDGAGGADRRFRVNRTVSRRHREIHAAGAIAHDETEAHRFEGRSDRFTTVGSSSN